MAKADYASTSERIKVPHDPLLIEYYDRPNFFEYMTYQFYTLIDTHIAWLIMLVRKNIVPESDSKPVLKALLELREKGPAALEYHEKYADVYTHMEQWLKEHAPPEYAAHLSLARTRPEPLLRMHIRSRLLTCIDQLNSFLGVLLKNASKYKDSVMPGYTHQQHAQPTTFGSYLLSFHDPLERDLKWLEMAYNSTNMCTMGCGALAGTRFDIDRFMVAELLGFEGIVESTFESVSTEDFVIQAVSAANDIMLTISRVVTDMEQWCNTEARFLDLAPQFATVSSLMPQKKNPGVFENIKGRGARVLGDTMAVYSCMHKAYYGDVVDIKASFIPATRVLDYATGTLKLFAGVIDTITPNEERMLEAAQQGFSTVSELVDEIIISEGIPHRIAHSVVAHMVTQALEKGLVATEITADLVKSVAEKDLKKKLSITDEQVKSSLDPVEFVKRHDLPGGPAPKETERMVKERQRWLSDSSERNKKRYAKLEQAERKLKEATEALMK